MRTSGILGIALLLVGLIVALVSLGSPCYALVVPGLPSTGASCGETFTIAAGGVALFAIGVILAVRGRR
jgi:hypothetical protein